MLDIIPFKKLTAGLADSSNILISSMMGDPPIVMDDISFLVMSRWITY